MVKERKRLVYHLWVPEYIEESQKKIYEIHFKCLKRYSSLFDDVIFVISYDKYKKDKIEHFKSEVIKLGFVGNLTVKILENRPFREAQTLYDYVMSDLNSYEGLTFFAHSKGLSNVSNKGFWKDRIDDYSVIYKWICFMYFMNLELYDEDVKTMLIDSDGHITYGTILTDLEKHDSVQKWIYSGSFYWINTKKLYKYIKVKNIYYPEITDRFYSENILGTILPFDFEINGTHDYRFMNDILNLYDKKSDWAYSFLSKEKFNKFSEFYKEINGDE